MFHVRTSARSGANPGIALVIGLLLAACTAGGGDGGGDGGDSGACPGTRDTATVTDGEVNICAADLAFDATTIEAPAGEEFNITFRNAEALPHNLAVYVEEDGEEIFVGEIITGPDVTTQLPIPALEAGTYYFRCDVHPEMEGTIVVEG
jgi:plastocyanin